MSLLNPHEALIYLMVITSAADREMTDLEMGRIGNVLKTWPVFQDFDDWKLIRVAQDCQQRLQEENGLASILAEARRSLPKKLHDTAYAAAFEVATVDLEMRMEELRVLEMIKESLSVDPEAIAAIERATKARHRTLT
jgi:tellurite resistance protein